MLFVLSVFLYMAIGMTLKDVGLGRLIFVFVLVAAVDVLSYVRCTIKRMKFTRQMPPPNWKVRKTDNH